MDYPSRQAQYNHLCPLKQKNFSGRNQREVTEDGSLDKVREKERSKRPETWEEIDPPLTGLKTEELAVRRGMWMAFRTQWPLRKQRPQSYKLNLVNTLSSEVDPSSETPKMNVDLPRLGSETLLDL